MKPKTGRKGARLERKSKQLLEDCGYTVIRAAGSKGPFDLIAFNGGCIRLIQIKANRKPGPAEREQMSMVEHPKNCTVEMWLWKDYARKPVIEVY